MACPVGEQRTQVLARSSPWCETLRRCRRTIYVYLYARNSTSRSRSILCKSSGQCAARYSELMSDWVRSPRRKVKTNTDLTPLSPAMPIQSRIRCRRCAGNPFDCNSAAAINVQINRLLVKEIKVLRNPRYVSIVMRFTLRRDS